MVAFNFQPSFAPPILDGSKMQTIRRQRRCKPGDPMHLFTGMRTKACRRLLTAPCVVADYVRLAPDGLTLGDVRKHPRNIDEFAALDGFPSFEAMLGWFVAQYGEAHFVGSVHRWMSPPRGAQHGE